MNVTASLRSPSRLYFNKDIRVMSYPNGESVSTLLFFEDKGEVKFV